MVRAYCELGFLDELFEETAKPSSVLDRVLSVDERLQQIESLAEFVFARCILIIENLDEFQLRAESDKNYNRMLKASLSGSSRISDTVEPKDDHHFLPVPTVELLSEESSKISNGKWRGLPISTDLHLANIAYLHLSRNCQVVPHDEKRNEFKGWKEFIAGILPIQNLVVADQYLYDGKSIKPNYNVRKILDAFLATKNATAQVGIAFLVNADLRDRLQRLHNNLQKYLSESYPTLSCTLLVQVVRGQEFHDRFMLTDYALVTSGHSFTYFNDKGMIKQSTTIQLTGVVDRYGSSNYFKLRQKVISELSKGKPGWDQVVGIVGSN